METWGVNGNGNYNALNGEVKHQFSHGFMSDAQFTWAHSLDTASAPYSNTLPPYALPMYPYDPSLNYGPSDYNVGKAFKLFGLWQPVLFHGSRGWMEKVAGGWNLSGIFNWHSGFPWDPYASVVGGNLYCEQLRRTSTCLPSTWAARVTAPATINSRPVRTFRWSPLRAMPWRISPAPAYTPYTGSNFGNANPQVARRNFLTGPGYRNVDMTLAKSFGLPNAPVLGENAKLELRMDVFNVFNNLNFNPTSIVSNINLSNFGVAQSALAARVLALTARFSF